MSDSLRIRFKNELEIDLFAAGKSASEILKKMLKQDDNFSVNISFFDMEGLPVSKIVPSGRVYSFLESNHANSGAIISFQEDEYWKEYSDEMVFEFCITEIPRAKNDILVLICLALILAVAIEYGAHELIDYSGLWSLKSDEVPVSDFIEMRNNEKMTLNLAVDEFFKKNATVEF
jgi:hypothetical protein